MKTKPFNDKLAQLTKLLSDGHYHDGNMLGQTMNMTRSAVWKMIKKLERYGIAINSIQSNGYALQEPLILLEPDLIKKALPYEIDITVLESIDSTNNFFKTSDKRNTIQCCLAERQTQGRGRLHRTWHSPFGKNLYLSCYYPFQKDISELTGLSLVVSLAVLSTLRTLGFTKDINVKWPNDVLCQEKKIAGILIDIQAESHGASDVTIGIGLNVNMTLDDTPSSVEFINQLWTSLYEEKGTAFDRNHVAAILLEHLLKYIRCFEQEGFAVFLNEWATVDSLHKKTVTVNYKNELITGEAVGVNQKGYLLLRLADDNVHAFSSGEISLVKK